MPSFVHPSRASDEGGAEPTPLTDILAALLRGKTIPWHAVGGTAAEFLGACVDQNLTNLVQQRLRTVSDGSGWPSSVQFDLTETARANVAAELSRREEITVALGALAAAQVYPILFKGTALAYTVYDRPDLRPRWDTDVLVRREDRDIVRRVLTDLDYVESVLCDGEFLLYQFSLTKTNRLGVSHTFDVHWKTSTQSLFADLLTYDELFAGAVPVPKLGVNARAADPVAALLLACVHPAMHHRIAERLIWLYDVHLLMSQLSAADCDQFVDLAIIKRVSAICAHELRRTQARLGTRIPNHVIARLGAARDESTSAYLRPRRPWHHELVSNLLGLPRWSDRLRLLREVIVPSPRYMLRAYGFKKVLPGLIWLPAFYLHRVAWGLTKVLMRWK